MNTYCFGIDVGGTTIKCGLFQTDGVLLEKWEIPTRLENNGDAILPDVAETVKAKIVERGLNLADVQGVGIGVPGPVNEAGDVPVAVNLHWGYKAVAKELGELTGLRAMAGNDANVAALGEAWAGAAKGANSIAFVTLGTGVGCGVILNGKILAGAHGAGGEFGHVNVNHAETESCNCGNQGCLEQYASATGIVRMANQNLAESEEDSVLRGIRDFSCKDVLDAYKAGDPLAVKTMEEVGEILGGGMATISTIVDPEALVVGGGVSKAGQPLLDLIRKYYKRFAFTATKETPIYLAQLGNDAGIYGAARMVLV